MLPVLQTETIIRIYIDFFENDATQVYCLKACQTILSFLLVFTFLFFFSKHVGWNFAFFCWFSLSFFLFCKTCWLETRAGNAETPFHQLIQNNLRDNLQPFSFPVNTLFLPLPDNSTPLAGTGI